MAGGAANSAMVPRPRWPAAATRAGRSKAKRPDRARRRWPVVPRIPRWCQDRAGLPRRQGLDDRTFGCTDRPHPTASPSGNRSTFACPAKHCGGGVTLACARSDAPTVRTPLQALLVTGQPSPARPSTVVVASRPPSIGPSGKSHALVRLLPWRRNRIRIPMQRRLGGKPSHRPLVQAAKATPLYGCFLGAGTGFGSQCNAA